jgi:hypothetical protein
MAGGGIRGGRVVGRTSADGSTIETQPTRVPDFLATVCRALGINPMQQNMSNVNRPIRIVDMLPQGQPPARPIREVLAS